MQDKNLQDRFLKAVLIVGGCIGGYFLIKSTIKNENKKDAFDKTGTDKNAQAASRLLSAMNPSGYDWSRGVDGTDEQAVFSAANSATSFRIVSRFYRQMTGGRILGDDLRSELSDSDLQRVQRIFSTKP